MKDMRVLICALGLLSAACAKDKTVAEYQREKLQENLALYQSVVGSYTGMVVSKEDGRTLGALEVELRADTIVDQSPGGESALGTPVLVSNIRFLNENVVSLSASSSFYDPGSGAYSAQIDVPRGQGGATEQVTVNGVLSGGTLTGEIATTNHPEAGGRFTLDRGGKPLTSLAKLKTPQELEDAKGSRQVSTFSGTTTFAGGAKRAVYIVVLQPLNGSAEDFLDLISPVKTVEVNFNYSQTLQILFPGALLDSRQGLLTGRTTINVDGQTQQMTLECRIESGDRRATCKHLTSASGVTATTVAAKDLTPASAPKDNPSERQSITKTFTGRGVMAGQARQMKLTVTLPSRGRMTDLVEQFFPNTEKYVNAAIEFAPDVTMSFMGIKWDSVNGLLDGSFTGQGGGDTFATYIQCHDFYFTETTGPFSCTYWTSRSPAIPIQFRPPYR